jgi:hypothetical protein
MKFTRHGLVAVLCIAMLAPAVGQADRRDERDHRHDHYDVRHGHNHYYPQHGFEVRAVPREARVIGWHGERYWFHEGVWYRPDGRGFVVIAPPFGVIVPVLPAFATLVVLGGVQYYYANDAYYRYYPDQGGYQVVAPPEGEAGPQGAPPADGDNAPPPPPSDNLFVYPKNDQSDEQQSRDRYECHRWAADQTAFDPTRPGGGIAPEMAGTKRADYLRAQQACLEARGYTVR